MKNSIKEQSNNYFKIFKEEKFDLLNNQIDEDQDLITRKNFVGHVTASGFVICGNQVLFIFHNKFKRYMQPGGHLELVDSNVIEAAKREVEEETGLKDIILHDWCIDNDCPIIIDSHIIPENKEKGEDKHHHHDFLYIFKTKNKDIILQEEEVSNFNWKDIDKIDENNPTMLKAVKKIKALNIC